MDQLESRPLMCIRVKQWFNKCLFSLLPVGERDLDGPGEWTQSAASGSFRMKFDSIMF